VFEAFAESPDAEELRDVRLRDCGDALAGREAPPEFLTHGAVLSVRHG
jgi:hypothetical protein